MDSSVGPEPNRARLINVGMWIVLVPTVMVTATKLYSKWFATRKFALDDAFILVAFAFALAQSITITQQIDAGFGFPQDELSSAQLDTVQKDGYVSQIFYVICIYTSKLSSTFFFTCLCSSQSHLKIVHGVSATITAWLVVSILTIAFQCHLPNPWDMLGGQCINLEAFWIFNATVDVLSQFVVSFLPVLLLKDLNMAVQSKKWLSMLAFTPNLVAVPLSILRAVYLVQALHSADYTYDAYEATLVTGLHGYIAVGAAAFPFIKPIIDSLIIQPYLVDEEQTVTGRTPVKGGIASKFRRTTRDSRLATGIKQSSNQSLKSPLPSPYPGTPARGDFGANSIGMGNVTAISTKLDNHSLGESNFDFDLQNNNVSHSRHGSTEHMVIRQTNTMSVESHPK